MTCFDLRPDSGCYKFLSHKSVAVIAAITQLVYMVAVLFCIIIPPDYLKKFLDYLGTGGKGFLIILVLICFGLSVLLLIGILQNNRENIKIYLICIVVSCVFGLVFNLLFFFMIRNYYLSLINPRPRSTGQV